MSCSLDRQTHAIDLSTVTFAAKVAANVMCARMARRHANVCAHRRRYIDLSSLTFAAKAAANVMCALSADACD